jgi:hypothetical protein
MTKLTLIVEDPDENIECKFQSKVEGRLINESKAKDLADLLSYSKDVFNLNLATLIRAAFIAGLIEEI